MSNITATGPINNGTTVVKNQSDLTRSRAQLKYIIVEEDASVADLSIDAAITKALSEASTDLNALNVNYGSIVRQDATANRFGPKKVEVTVQFGRSPAPPSPSGSEGIMAFSARVTNVPVYRLPFVTYADGATIPAPNAGTCNSSNPFFIASSSTCSVPAVSEVTGLPQGDFADVERLSGTTANAKPARGSGLRRYPFAVSEVAVSIPARVTQASFYSVVGGTNAAMPKVGFYNSNAFEWGTGSAPSGAVSFPVKTLRFDGVDAQWVQENGVFIYYLKYLFTWRPTGWFEQRLVDDAANAGYLTTEDVNTASRTIQFGGSSGTPRIDFPLS